MLEYSLVPTKKSCDSQLNTVKCFGGLLMSVIVFWFYSILLLQELFVLCSLIMFYETKFLLYFIALVMCSPGVVVITRKGRVVNAINK